MKRLFAVYPGWVTSINDWERHFISASQLMNLYRVRPQECVVIDPSMQGYMMKDAYDILGLMPLYPLTGVDYRPVSDYEREQIKSRLAVDRIPDDYDIYDGPMPRYQGEAIIELHGQKFDLNELEPPFGNE